jgi:hypothetical protein
MSHAIHSRRSSAWVRVAVIALVVEKIVQHIAVTAAFAFDWRDIGATVAVSPTVLMVLGAGVAVAFALSLWGLLVHRAWAIDLVIALALFDIVGEFVAQGKLGISLTVSFLAAILLLIVTLLDRRQGPKGAT